MLKLKSMPSIKQKLEMWPNWTRFF